MLCQLTMQPRAYIAYKSNNGRKINIARPWQGDKSTRAWWNTSPYQYRLCFENTNTQHTKCNTSFEKECTVKK